ncbi:poly(ethylene terephthalate) hydrolase family protein [[Actinomadura] parvosata]|uniref:poly(ethylene terephthalate) hydrolase family protein n=1 Tax=[Actinomadura] parvosata TaxID=1955412 RepID=UPI00406C09F7
MAGLCIASALALPGPAHAADSPFQRGPDPTSASVAASRGTFATANVSVPAGNGFGGGVIYYPADTSQGTFGAVAIVPGYTATWAAEGAWMGHWLASFGFVVIGIDTNNRNDWDTARGTQLLAALDYLTQRSSVRDRVDAGRLAVMGHSMGGGGAMHAALQRPSLKAAVGLAPFSPSQNLTNLRVPTMLLAGQNDTTTTPAGITTLYNGIPAATEKAYLELTGAGHGFPTSSNSVMMRKVIPWLKIFLDQDTRYSQFLCPLMDWTGIAAYRSTCPLDPGGTGSATRYEAENSPAVCTGTIDSNHAGYSGAGFCNGDNAAGAYAQFTINASTAGTVTLRVRYANGTTTARPTSLLVNGSTAETPSFDGTGAWTTWATSTWTITLNAGGNTIQLNPTTPGGLPNIDYVEVAPL